jgi:hypothetical protein
MSVKIYMDVHVRRAMTDGLRLRGVDVLTAQEDGTAELEDSALLDRATELERLKFGYTKNDGLVRTGSGSDRLKMRVSRSLPLPVLTRRDRICNP